MRHPALLAVLAATLAVPSSALAADRYVTTGGSNVMNDCLVEANPCRTIQRAVDVADAGDTIRVGAGLFEESVEASVPVHVVGVGAGNLGDGLQIRTWVRSPDALPAFLLPSGSVRALRATGGDDDLGLWGSPAIRANLMVVGPDDDLLVEDVIASGGVDASGKPGSGIDANHAVGFLDGTTVTIRDTTIVTDPTATVGGAPMINLSAVDLAVDDLTLRPTTNDEIGRLRAGVRGTVDRLVVPRPLVARDGLEIGTDVQVGFTRSRLAATTAAVDVDPGVDSDIDLTFRDSEVVTVGPNLDDPPAILARATARGTTDVTLTRSTVHAYGGGPEAAVRIQALPSTPNPGVAVVRAVDSVLRVTDTVAPVEGVDVVLFSTGIGEARFEATRSAYSTVRTVPDATSIATATAPGANGGIVGAPGFTNAAQGDLTLAPGSPLVDRGAPAPDVVGLVDLDGLPRATDGDGDCVAAVDIGAHEAAAAPTCTPVVPPTPPTGPTPPGTTPSDTVRPGLTGVRVTSGPRRGQRRLRWRLSERADLLVTVQRPRAGRRVGGRCLAPTRARRTRKACTRYVRLGSLRVRGAAAGPGVRTLPTRLASRPLRGRVRLVVTATDPAGNRSPARTVTARLP